MSYIIQARRSATGNAIGTSRTASTLEGARYLAARVVHVHIGWETNLGYRRRPLTTPRFIAECHEIGEDGGQVELPSGIVIEVLPA